MNQEKNEKVQSKYTEFQLLSQQIPQLEEQLNNVNDHFSELISLKNNINELKSIKDNTEILVHLGHNIFTKAKITNTGEYIAGIGGGVLVNKDSKSTVEFISNQINELEDLKEIMERKVNEARLRIYELQEELSNMIKEENEDGQE